MLYRKLYEAAHWPIQSKTWENAGYYITGNKYKINQTHQTHGRFNILSLTINTPLPSLFFPLFYLHYVFLLLAIGYMYIFTVGLKCFDEMKILAWPYIVNKDSAFMWLSTLLVLSCAYYITGTKYKDVPIGMLFFLFFPNRSWLKLNWSTSSDQLSCQKKGDLSGPANQWLLHNVSLHLNALWMKPPSFPIYILTKECWFSFSICIPIT